MNVSFKTRCRLFFEEIFYISTSPWRSGEEKIRAKKLRDDISLLISKEGGTSAALSSWEHNIRDIRRQIMKRDPRNFLHWHVVTYTMVHGAKKPELDYLKNDSQWGRWEKTLQESWVGHSKPYAYYPTSSGNQVHMVYHLARYSETFPEISFKNFSTIFEFGGGYGLLAKLISGLGFHGTYIIFDLPEFNALQEYYLSAHGIKVSRKPMRGPVVILLSNLDDLKKQFELTPTLDMFIALWSLSESPISVRENIFARMPQPQYWMIGYQEGFDGADNLRYFSELKQKNNAVTWIEKDIPYLLKQHYLFGKK